jgi:hypothetical protein
MSAGETRRRNWVKILIVAVPVWLLGSGAVGLWLHFQQEEKERQKQPHAYRKDINPASLADDYEKIITRIGPRHLGSNTATDGLKRMASMLGGALGTSNIGYEVQRFALIGADEKAAPILLVDVLCRQTKQEIWVVIPYDSPPEMPVGSASASAVTVSLAVAQSLIGKPLERNVRFLYLPAAYAEEDRRMNAAAQVQRMIAASTAEVEVVVLGTMLHAGELMALARDSSHSVRAAGNPCTVSEDAAICLQEDGELSALLHNIDVSAALLFKKHPDDMNEAMEDGIKAPTDVLGESADQVAELLTHMAGTAEKK